MFKFTASFCFCLTLSAIIHGHENGPGAVEVVVKEGSDAILPCSPIIKENLEQKLFDWKKDGQKEVFLYDAGVQYINDWGSQDEQFKGRVSHFAEQLKFGNASIMIQNTKMADSGDYSCVFPRLEPNQIFHIKLLVEHTLRDRSGENTGAVPEPYIKIINATKDGVQLQCELRGAFPKPKVEWQDSAGNILPAEDTQVSEREGRFYVTLRTIVNKADHYRCAVQQEEIHHKTAAETYVPFYEKLCEDQRSTVDIGWFCGLGLVALVLVGVEIVLVATKRITVRFNRGPCQQTNSSSDRSSEMSLESQHATRTDNENSQLNNPLNGCWTPAPAVYMSKCP